MIILLVGGTRFHTRKSTLTEKSTYFASLLSGRWSDAQSDDGTLFVDADPKVFEHLLAYMRRGLLPIFFDKTRGFDHALYRKLLSEADFFLVEALAKWIRGKEYLKAVKVEYELATLTRVDDGLGKTRIHKATTDMDTEQTVSTYHGTQSVYRCPRGEIDHNWFTDRCKKKCRDLKDYIEQSGGSCCVETKVVTASIMTKKIVFQDLEE